MSNLALANNSVALYAFSADPITNGHINIVERVAASFDRCIVGIGRNPMKTYMFDLATRKSLAELALSHLPNVEVLAFEGMVVDFAYEQGANVIVKGIRSSADVEYEQVLHQVGVSQKMGIDTHLLYADPDLAHVSSSVVKAMQAEHGFIQDYVPPVVKATLEKKISNQLIIGLTGHIASGKSILADKLVSAGKDRGVEVHNIDLDRLGHQVLAGENIGVPMHRKITEALVNKVGSSVMVDGVINRTALATKVFGDETARQALNDILLKPMAIVLRRALKELQGVILLNGALLADLGLLGLCNYRCILCEVSETVQRSRLTDRGLNTSEIDLRLNAQANGKLKKVMIEDAINQRRFGQLWEFASPESSEQQLLDAVIHDCEVFECKS